MSIGPDSIYTYTQARYMVNEHPERYSFQRTYVRRANEWVQTKSIYSLVIHDGIQGHVGMIINVTPEQAETIEQAIDAQS